MMIIVRLFILLSIFAYTISAIPSGQDSRKWSLSSTGKKMERKMMKEPAQIRTPQARETLIREELIRHSDNAKAAGEEKAKLEEKMSQKKHSLNSFKGKVMSILPNSTERKLKTAMNKINHSNKAVQNISKDLDYHQRQGHIHDLSNIYQTIQEIQSGDKKRYSSKEGSSNRQQSISHGGRRISQTQPNTPISSPTRPLLGSSQMASHIATPARSPIHSQAAKTSSSKGASSSRTPPPRRPQPPRRDR